MIEKLEKEFNKSHTDEWEHPDPRELTDKINELVDYLNSLDERLERIEKTFIYLAEEMDQRWDSSNAGLKMTNYSENMVKRILKSK